MKAGDPFAHPLSEEICRSCGTQDASVQERYSFGVYAGVLCHTCALKFRDHCGIDHTKRRLRMPKIEEFYMGIDPGKGGAIAVIRGQNVGTLGLSCTDRQIWEYVNQYKNSTKFLILEKVGGYIGHAHPGSAMFNFGVSFGTARAFVTAANIPFQEVTPQKWQKALGIPKRKKSESKGQWKNRLKSFAERLFPTTKITLVTADAILIAEYCRRWREGKL